MVAYWLMVALGVALLIAAIALGEKAGTWWSNAPRDDDAGWGA